MTEHTSDLVRSATGKVLARYSHDQGPCLLDFLDALADVRRQTQKNQRELQRRIRALEREEREARHLIQLNLSRAAVAGRDANLSFRETAERMGVAPSTIHRALGQAPRLMPDLEDGDG